MIQADGRTKGFFTDTTLCIGCKACEVACKQWNELPDDGFLFTGMSYDNTVQLGASTWRHVAFIERPVALSNQDAGAFSWLFSSECLAPPDRWLFAMRFIRRGSPQRGTRAQPSTSSARPKLKRRTVAEVKPARV